MYRNAFAVKAGCFSIAPRNNSLCTRGRATVVSHPAPLHMQPPSPLDELHIAVLGPVGQGKSALVVRLIQNTFLTEYDPTSARAVRSICSPPFLGVRPNDAPQLRTCFKLLATSMESCNVSACCTVTIE